MSSGSATANNSLIQATAKARGVTHGANGNKVGQDPLLAALADNGCVVPSGSGGACAQTHALRTGSPALDAGSNPDNLTTDQRGWPRQAGSAVDMGAFEFQSSLGLTVTGGGSGDGTVSGNGLNCTLTAGTAFGACTATLDEGTAMSLTATATTGSSFDSWTDATCQDTTNPCAFTLREAKTLTAAFDKLQYGLTVTGGGTGTGTISGNGLDCMLTAGTTSGTCTTTLDHGTAVSLTATASSGSTFGSWSDASCGTANPCSLTLTAVQSLTATFTQQTTTGGGTDLSPIIAAFGTSREYTNRFSGLSDAELIHNLYRNMFDRTAEPGGLRFYLALLETYCERWRDAHAATTKAPPSMACPGSPWTSCSALKATT